MNRFSQVKPCLLMMTMLFVVSCGGGGSSSSTNTSGSTSSNPSGAPSSSVGKITGNAVAMVFDSSGQPLENAVFDGSNVVSDSQGGAEGTLDAQGGTWVKVSAAGYADDYTSSLGKDIHGWRVYAPVRMTPLDDSVVHDTSQSDTLVAGDATSPTVQVNLDPGLFDQDGVVVQLASLDPANVGPAYAFLSDGADLHLDKSFFVTAKDAASDQDVSFAQGATVSVTVKDDGSLGSQFELASFDASSGTWQVVPNGCQRSDSSHLQCTLPHFSTWGVFGNSSPAPSGDSYEQAYQQCLASLHAAERAASQKFSTDPKQASTDFFPSMEAPMTALGQAALNYASAHPSELAVQRLLGAAGLADLFGMSDLNLKLAEAAYTLIGKLGQAMLDQTTQCAAVRPLLAMSAENDMVGNSQVALDLWAKVVDFSSQCQLWAGGVTYTYVLPASLPTLGFPQVKGPHSWMEHHDIKFDLNPKTNTLQGDDEVKTNFAKITYQQDLGPECGGESMTTWENYATPDPGHLYLTLSGSYDPTTKKFAIDMPVVGTSSSGKPFPPINLSLHINTTAWMDSPCTPVPVDSVTPEIDGYQSILVSSINGQPQGPTLAEMLNTGSRHDYTSPAATVIEGHKIITLNNPIPTMLPLTKVIVHWSFSYIDGEVR